ncbi:MAG: AAA family ATPase [Chloroflexota bacterium]
MTPLVPPIELPRSGLVVLIGPSSSGKSTWAARHARPTEILSSDTFRALVSDDANDQDATLDAFDVLHLVAARRMAHRRLSIVDATNVEGWARTQLLDLARTHDARTIAIVFDVALEVCLARNAVRDDRRLPEAALRRQWTRMRRSIPQLATEGWDGVRILAGADAVDAVSVMRSGTSAPRTQRSVPKEPRPTR